jgi:amidase
MVSSVIDSSDVGPMGHSPRDLKLYCKTIVDSKPWFADPKIVPIPWRSIELPSQLSFAVIKTNNIINPLPPLSRAMEYTITKLKEAGHEIIEWDLSNQSEASELGVYPA